MSDLCPKIRWLGLVDREEFEPVYPSLMRVRLIPNGLPALKCKTPPKRGYLNWRHLIQQTTPGNRTACCAFLFCMKGDRIK